ncbi:MAG: DnaJ domain-containing protein [Nanoarchaeota archaeon]
MIIKIKGNEIEAPNIETSFDRRAIQLKNSIIDTLGLLGLTRYDTEIKLEMIARKKAPASASFYFDGRNLKYTYSLMPKFVENMAVIDKILKIYIQKLIDGEITLDEFKQEFSEDDDLPNQLIEARKTLDVDENEKDFEVISKKYKNLAKKYHPDMPEGNHEMFQKINGAHKLIQKELI